MRSDLARARGIGAAKDGVAHWWAQRLTALALIPLALWFVGSIIGLVGASHSAALAWIGSPATAVLLIVLIAATFHHAQLGVQVVIEDYVHHEGLKVAAVVVVKAVAILLAVAAVLAVLKIAVKG
ncbi:MAG TPA: succinate dehydrogenase, hydrophobic membrane anchor protein [Alphaproteobacteria bacterium]|nr:succinate dehydrogenase, hydrophobic membrane anchor protein [Alphaproteobacteria bacterium]